MSIKPLVSPSASTSIAPCQATGRLALYSSVGVAAAAMVCTLPGRTHGLGLITEPLLTDLQIDRVAYAALNFWATLLGSLACIPCGWLVDRFGIRFVLAMTLLALGGVVLAMAQIPIEATKIVIPAAELFFVQGVEWTPVPLGLFGWILLTRALGQSALSVISLALIGRLGGRKSGMVIGVYSFLVAVGFMMAFGIIKAVLEQAGVDWRTLWAGLGWTLIGAFLLTISFFRNPSQTLSVEATRSSAADYTLGQALRTPAFWVFGLSTSYYGLVAAGMSLFHQSILAERNFDREVFLNITVVSPMVGLLANLLTGWLALRFRLGKLLAVGLLIQTGALLAFPLVDTLTHVYAYAVAMGIAGGMMTVLFFSVWGQWYGPTHLGQIQGAAQLLTVLASAAGPLFLAAGHRSLGSYAPVLQTLAVVSLMLAALAWFVPIPVRSDLDFKDSTS